VASEPTNTPPAEGAGTDGVGEVAGATPGLPHPLTAVRGGLARGANPPAHAAMADHAPVAQGRVAARKFVGRLAQLDPEAVYASVQAWRETMREDVGAWFAAEEAVARAVVASGRHDEQRPLLMYVAEAFAYGVWYGAGYGGRARLTLGESAPELRVRATEASGQYLATVAMLALLVRDHLEPAEFALLYRPFAALIPADDLARE
jgi:hypothetical protein